MKIGRILPLAAGLLLGASQLAVAANQTFVVNDTPGHWFDAGPAWDLGGTRSLVVVNPGDTVYFTQTVGPKAVESRHTVTSLIWPAGSNPSELLDQDSANMNDHQVQLTTTGLHVFVCKLHPYMLGAVIVDDPSTPELDLGENLVLLGGPGGTVPFPTIVNGAPTDIALRVLRAFFIVTNPGNWKDYTKVGTAYAPSYPAVPVRLGSLVVADLNAAMQNYFVTTKKIDGGIIEKQNRPKNKGIGEVWVDTAYELSAGKPEQFPGTMTVVSATGWNVKRKIALPEQKMNNGHNFWTSHDQKEIYQTEWHGNSLYVINRRNGKLMQEIDLVNGSEVNDPKFGGKKCYDPAHVMTRVDTQQVHAGCNGDDTVVELNRDPATGLLSINRFITMSQVAGSKQTQPHAHWMGFDGKSMVTPNSNTGDSTLYDFNNNVILDQEPTGTLPIATGMMPDSSKYYVSNYLGHTISVMCGPNPKPAGSCVPGQKLSDVSLLLNGNYDPVGGAITGPIGGFSVQTPVSPDGKFAIQGNTLTGTITIIDTATDTLVKMISCDPGCHGVNFGAKKRGGYYAYVTSKFANRLIVLDYDPNNDGNVDDAVVVGAVVLAKDDVAKDDQIVGNKGFGAQGIMAVPNVYNGWVQELPTGYKAQLTRAQRNPIGPIGGRNPHKDKDDDDHDDDRGDHGPDHK
jgi:DNA-binding beta-propeller fold protein YncE